MTRVLDRLIVVFAVLVALSSCGGGGGNGGTSGVSSAPTSPTPSGTASARFAAPSSVMSYAAVVLDGTLTRDPTLAIASYAWTQTAGPAVTLNGATTSTASFTAPAVTSQTTLIFKLSVTDSNGGVSVVSNSISVVPASVAALTPAILGTRFLAPVNDNQHSDAVPVDGPPLAGSSALLEVSLQGAVQTPSFNLVDTSGNVLNTAALAPSGSTATQPLDFVGSITVPNAPFTVTAAGTTADGQTYSLKSNTIFTPTTFTVQWTPPSLTLAKGGTLGAALMISNGGNADTFTVQFQDPGGALSSAGSLSAQVGSNQSVTLPVNVTFPSVSSSPAALLLTATVSNSGNTQAGSTVLTVWLDGSP